MKPYSIPPQDEDFWIDFPSHGLSVSISFQFGLKNAKIKTANVTKVIAEGVSDKSITAPQLHCLALNVFLVYVPFDIDRYRREEDRFLKSDMIANAILVGMTFFEEHTGVSIQPVREIAAEARLNKYVYDTNVGKAIPSPNRSYWVQLHCRWDWDTLFLQAVLKDRKKQEIGRKDLAQRRSAGVGYVDFFKSARWINEYEFVIDRVETLFPGVHLHVDEILRQNG